MKNGMPMDDAQRIAQMLQQQHIQKLMQGMSAPVSNADAAMMRNYENMTQIPQMDTRQGMPINTPVGEYDMPITQPNTMSNMPTGATPTRRGLLQSGINDLDLQNIGQGIGRSGATMVNTDMMRKMPR